MSLTTNQTHFADFPAATDADWRQAAEEGLAGASFEKKLITRTPEGIDLQPIYSRADGEKLSLPEAWPGLAPYVRGVDALGSRANGWFICQEPGSRNHGEFNAALRHDLLRGQNAVSLPLDTATRLGLDPESAQSSEVADRGLSLTTVEEVESVLRGVDISAVPLFVSAGLAALPITALLTSWLTRQGQPAGALNGAVLADPFSEWLRRGNLPVSLDKAYDDMALLTQWANKDQLRLRTVGVDAGLWAEAGASAVQELAFGLATGVHYLHALHRRKISADKAGPRFLFTYSLGSNLFMEIAKLRAARLLWARVIEAAGGGTAAQRLVCHGRTTRWNKTMLDQHVNLLRTTTEAFAGIVGGCSGLQVGAFDECHRTPDEFSQRLARNIQIILAEECQLSRVVDPAGGSWYIETLTRQLAEKAWTLFQDIARKGGMAAAIHEGFPQTLVEKTANDRLSAVESRRDSVIGTNLQPNLREKPVAVEISAVRPVTARTQPDAGARIALARLMSCDPTVLPSEIQTAFAQGASLGAVTAALASTGDAAPTVKKVTARRRAEPFEALRRRSEAFLSRTGARPKAFLATMGPRKQHAARADFSSGFFAAGGFETIPNKGFDTPEAAAEAAIKSGAPIVILCSTDETYPVLVPPLAQALKAAAKPPIIVLAGLPATPELQQQFKAAGVDEFIHVRANCAKLLASFQDKLGL